MSGKQFTTFVAVALAVIALSACKARTQRSAAPETTQTVAPAAAQPSPNGTDATTQTVNVDDGRSDDEGGTAAASDTTATATPAPAKPAKSAKKHK